MTYCIDIDGTLCSNTNGEYNKAKPFYDRIKKVNILYNQGNTIVLYTSRGSTTGKHWKDLTEKQLKEWEVKYTKLLLGKPFYDIWVDDKAVNSEDFFKEPNV